MDGSGSSTLLTCGIYHIDKRGSRAFLSSMQFNSLLKLLVCLVLIFAAPKVFAQPTTTAPSVIVGWDVTPQTNVIGYTVYWGGASRNYTNSILVSGRSNTTATVANLLRGVTYYFAATCRDGSRESDYSLEATYTTTPLPTAPVNVRVSTQNP